MADTSTPKKQKVQKVAKKVVKKVANKVKTKSGFLQSVNEQEQSSSEDSESELDPDIFCDSSDDEN